MKAIVCILLLATCAFAEEKQPEKRGVVGLGYGLGAPAPLLGGGLYGGHGLGLYNGLYGGGLLGSPLVGHSAPLLAAPHALAPAPLLTHGALGAPLLHGGYGAPLLGLGHGYLH